METIALLSRVIGSFLRILPAHPHWDVFEYKLDIRFIVVHVLIFSLSNLYCGLWSDEYKCTQNTDYKRLL